MLRLMIFLIGFGFAVIGFSYIITYLNYLTVGYSFKEYLKLIIIKPECLLAFIGIIMLGIILFTRRDAHDIRL